MPTWNTSFEQTPAGSESPSLGDDRFRELKTATRERLEKEHVQILSSGLAGEDGWHRGGSAKVYFQSGAPTTRPDGSTALTAEDNGRVWISSTDYKLRVYNHAAGVTSADRWVLENDQMPVGMILPFAGETASVPTGWLLCNGTAVSRTDYASLHAILKDVGGTNLYGWGSGDGSTTFNLPDLREVYLVGTGTRAAGVTAHDAFNLAQMKDDQAQGHYHSAQHYGSGSVNGFVGSASQGGSGPFVEGAALNHITAPKTDGINGTPRTGTVTRGKGVGVNYIIKARSVDANYTSETAAIDTRLTTLEALGYSFRNKFINGNLDHWQRGTSLSLTGAGTTIGYLADRFKVWVSGTGSSTTYSRQAFSVGQTDVPNNPKYYLRSLCTNGGDSTNGLHVLIQQIENVNTLAGKKATLSFWAQDDAAKNISIEIVQSFGTGGSPSSAVNTFAQKIAIGTTWTKYTVQIEVPSIAGKTIGSDGVNTSSLGIFIWMSAGSAFNARTDTLGVQTGTFDFAQFQLEEGEVATKFEERPVGLELELCQRYYEKSYDVETVPGTATTVGIEFCSGSTETGNVVNVPVRFKVYKRKANSNINAYSSAGTLNRLIYTRSGVSPTEVVATATNIGSAGCYFNPNCGAAWVPCHVYGHWTADAEF